MPDEQTHPDTDETPRIASVTSGAVSRRNVLRTTASAVAGGSLLITVAGEASAATQDDGQLNVRTTDVEILDDEPEGDVRAIGRVSGMSNYDCERCKVGAQVKPVGGDEWHGGLQTVEHTYRDSFRVGVTLAGLHPGKYRCRLCACPITHDHVFVANVLVIVVKRHEKERKKKKKKHDKHGKKLKKAYEKRCPCELYHPDEYHLMVCGGDASNVYEYTFRATTPDVAQVGLSNAPDVIDSHHVTAMDAEDYVRGRTVTGAVSSGADSYVCGGALEAIQVDEGASVFVNGMEVTHAVNHY